MKQQFCFPLNNKGFLFVKNSLVVSWIYDCRSLKQGSDVRGCKVHRVCIVFVVQSTIVQNNVMTPFPTKVFSYRANLQGKGEAGSRPEPNKRSKETRCWFCEAFSGSQQQVEPSPSDWCWCGRIVNPPHWFPPPTRRLKKAGFWTCYRFQPVTTECGSDLNVIDGAALWCLDSVCNILLFV